MLSYRSDHAEITGLSWKAPISEGHEFLFGAYRFTIRSFDDLLVGPSQLPLYVFTREDGPGIIRFNNFAFNNEVILYHQHKEIPSENWDLRDETPWNVDRSIDYLRSKRGLIMKMYDDNPILSLPLGALGQIIQNLQDGAI